VVVGVGGVVRGDHAFRMEISRLEDGEKECIVGRFT